MLHGPDVAQRPKNVNKWTTFGLYVARYGVNVVFKRNMIQIFINHIKKRITN